MLYQYIRRVCAGAAVLLGLITGHSLSADPVEAELVMQGRSQGDGQGKAIPHQAQVGKANVGYNAKQGFAFRSFIVFDLSANLVDMEEGKKVELVTGYNWGGTGSDAGWEFVCLGAFDDADLTNKTVMGWGEPDGNRYAKPAPVVGKADPSQGATSYGVEGLLTLDVTESALKSGVSVEKPFLWFRVQAAQTDEPESWGGLSVGPERTKLLIHVDE